MSLSERMTRQYFIDRLCTCVILATLLSSACASEEPATAASNAGDRGATGLDNPTGLAGSGSNSADEVPGSGPPPAVGSSSEVCDGVDNDSNGIIDDVDAEGDGVCDCLNIATIGQIGPWSNGGNVFKNWLDARSPQRAVELGDQVLTDELLSKLQVIVVLYAATFEVNGNNNQAVPAHHAFSDAEVAAFQRWVERGGGVMTTTGYTSDEARENMNVNRLLAPFGIGYSDTKLDVDGYIRNWSSHPLSSGVMNINTMNGVEPTTTTGVTVARDQANHVALQASEAKLGHVVVWGDEWITYDSQWTMVQDQQVERLWLNIFKWLSPAKVCQVPIKGPQ